MVQKRGLPNLEPWPDLRLSSLLTGPASPVPEGTKRVGRDLLPLGLYPVFCPVPCIRLCPLRSRRFRWKRCLGRDGTTHSPVSYSGSLLRPRRCPLHLVTPVGPKGTQSGTSVSPERYELTVRVFTVTTEDGSPGPSTEQFQNNQTTYLSLQCLRSGVPERVRRRRGGRSPVPVRSGLPKVVGESAPEEIPSPSPSLPFVLSPFRSSLSFPFTKTQSHTVSVREFLGDYRGSGPGLSQGPGLEGRSGVRPVVHDTLPYVTSRQSSVVPPDPVPQGEGYLGGPGKFYSRGEESRTPLVNPSTLPHSTQA